MALWQMTLKRISWKQHTFALLSHSFCGSGIPGSLWLRLWPEIAPECRLGLLSSEWLAGAGRSTSKMVHSHGVWLQFLTAQPLHWPLDMTAGSLREKDSGETDDPGVQSATFCCQKQPTQWSLCSQGGRRPLKGGILICGHLLTTARGRLHTC